MKIALAVSLIALLIALLLVEDKTSSQPKIDKPKSRQPIVNMEIIKAIESSGNPNAFNKGSGATGLYQITPICLQDFNNYNGMKKYTIDDMFSPSKSYEVAHWYMFERIPVLLAHFNQIDNLENRLVAYNAGIGKVISGDLPNETINYIAKYRKAMLNAS